MGDKKEQVANIADRDLAIVKTLIPLSAMVLAGLAVNTFLPSQGIDDVTGKLNAIECLKDYGPPVILSGAIALEAVVDGFQNVWKTFLATVTTAVGTWLAASVPEATPTVQLSMSAGLPLAIKAIDLINARNKPKKHL